VDGELVLCAMPRRRRVASALSLFQFESFPRFAVEEGPAVTGPSDAPLLPAAAGIWSRNTWPARSGYLAEAGLWVWLLAGTLKASRRKS
jgi:hypothetical protein